VSHQVGAINGELPFEAKVAFVASLCVFGNYGDEERAGQYLAADRRVPRIAAAQLALVEPYLDTGLAQGVAQLQCSLGVLGRVAQEYCTARFVQGALITEGRLDFVVGGGRPRTGSLFVARQPTL